MRRNMHCNPLSKYALIIVLLIAMIATIHALDTRWRYVPYTISISILLSSLIFSITRRSLFSTLVGISVVLVLAAISYAKFELKGFALHYYDFVFTGFDTDAVRFLATQYSLLAFLLVSGIACLVALLVYSFLRERPAALSVRKRLGLIALAAVAVVGSHMEPKPGEPEHLPYAAGYNGSAFFLSLSDIRFPLDGLEITKRVYASAVHESLDASINCGNKRPDVIMILSESQTDLTNFPQLNIPAELKASFRSQDGRHHPLYVEVFGGSTWVTNFSVMTGLSASDFGWQRDYVTQLMESRIRGSLPETFSHCGYRTVSVMPVPYNFVNEGPFLRSIGFQEVIDETALDLPKEGLQGLSDAPYFNFVETLVKDHQAADERPLFVAMQTLATHAPYDVALAPGGDASGSSYSDDAATNEYVRRVAESRARLQDFLAEREKAPGRNGTVIIEYGDHQSVGTIKYLNQLMNGAPMFLDPRALTFRTFFAVHSYGHFVDYSQLEEPIDVAFLSASVIQAAGLPSSEVFRDLVRLRDDCGGRFSSCQNRALIDDHLKRRVNSGSLNVE